jgi:8-oxoguanine DNA glycosylase, N-terminal domain
MTQIYTDKDLRWLIRNPCFIRVNLWQVKMIEISAPDFDLAITLDSGQVFHWQEMGDGFVGTIADLPGA